MSRTRLSASARSTCLSSAVAATIADFGAAGHGRPSCQILGRHQPASNAPTASSTSGSADTNRSCPTPPAPTSPSRPFRLVRCPILGLCYVESLCGFGFDVPPLEVFCEPGRRLDVLLVLEVVGYERQQPDQGPRQCMSFLGLERPAAATVTDPCGQLAGPPRKLGGWGARFWPESSRSFPSAQELDSG